MKLCPHEAPISITLLNFIVIYFIIILNLLIIEDPRMKALSVA